VDDTQVGGEEDPDTDLGGMKTGTALADKEGRAGKAAAAGRAETERRAGMEVGRGNTGADKAEEMVGKAGRGRGAISVPDQVERDLAAGRGNKRVGTVETVGMVDKGKGALSVPDRVERALPVGRGGMDRVVLEDLDDPTGSRRRAAGTAVCSSNSGGRLYYSIPRNSCGPLGCTAPAGSSHCSRNIHLA